MILKHLLMKTSAHCLNLKPVYAKTVLHLGLGIIAVLWYYRDVLKIIVVTGFGKSLLPHTKSYCTRQ